MQKPRKLPRDANSLAARIVALSTGQEPTQKSKGGPQPEENETKNPAAVELGRKGGLKGGKSRAAILSPEQRSDIARIAASARWKKD